MKKIIALVLMLVTLIPALCFAGKVEPVIRSDSRTFNPLSGVYDLQGNVFVQFPAKNKILTITGDATQVHLYAMEVHGQGNITLTYDDLTFKCNKVDVYHSDSSAHVSGNLLFTQGQTRITANEGVFNWKNKQAEFDGNVTVNGKPHEGLLTYDVIQQKIVDTAPAAVKAPAKAK